MQKRWGAMRVAVGDDDLLARLPDDIVEAGRQLLSGALQADGLFGSAIKQGVRDNLDVISRLKGDPAALHRGETIIRNEVRGQIAQAKSALHAGLDGINFRGAWEGSAANAFLDYVPRLLAAMTTMETRCEDIADAIAGLRDAIVDMWRDVVGATISAAAKTASALDQKDKAKLVVEIVNAWIDAIKDYIDAFFSMYASRYTAMDRLNNARSNTANLAVVAGAANFHYDGPTGNQLPMPTDVSLDADWTATDIRGRWVLKPGGVFAIQLEPFNALVSTLRANGDYWNAAAANLVEAWAALPAGAFSTAAAAFYPELGEVLAADYLTYSYADERLNQLGNLLGMVAAAYGQADDNASTMLREYQTNR